jgi:hypothetical protein
MSEPLTIEDLTKKPYKTQEKSNRNEWLHSMKAVNSDKDFGSDKYIKTHKDSEDEAASDSEEELREATPKASRRSTEESPLGDRLAPCATFLPPRRNYSRSKAVHMDLADVLRAPHRSPFSSVAPVKNEDLDDESQKDTGD